MIGRQQLIALFAISLLVAHVNSLSDEPATQQTNPSEPCQQMIEGEESPDTAASLLSVEGMRLKLACESARDDKTAAAIRVTQAHDKRKVQDNDLLFTATQAVKTTERLSQMTKNQEIQRASAGVRLGAVEAQQTEQQQLADAQTAFANVAQQSEVRESEAAAIATSTKQNAVELAISSWRARREAARQEAHQEFGSAERQMAQGLAAASATQTHALDAADATRNAAVPPLQKQLTDFEHATKQLSAELKSSGKDQAVAVAEYDTRYKQQEVVAAEVHAQIKQVEGDVLAAKTEANIRHDMSVDQLQKAMQAAKANAVARKAHEYKATRVWLQQHVDDASSTATKLLQKRQAATEESLETAATARDKARAEAIAAASDATEAAKQVADQQIASTYQAQREARASEALQQATRFREQALDVHSLGPSL